MLGGEVRTDEVGQFVPIAVVFPDEYRFIAELAVGLSSQYPLHHICARSSAG